MSILQYTIASLISILSLFPLYVCHPFPTSYTNIKSFFINSPCSHFQVTSTKYFCLSIYSVIFSYDRNGSQTHNSIFQINNSAYPKIRNFQLLQNSSQLIFYQVGTSFQVYQLSTVNLTVNKIWSFYSDLKNYGSQISGAVKVGTDMIYVTVITGVNQKGVPVSHFFFRYNITANTWSLYQIININETLFIKVSPQKKCVVFWNRYGMFYIYYIESKAIQKSLNQFPAASSAYNLSLDSVFFSDDDTKMGVLINATKELHFYQWETFGNASYLRRFSGGVSPDRIQIATFWSCNFYVAIFSDSLIIFYNLTDTTWTKFVQINSYTFTNNSKISWKTNQVIFCSQTYIYNSPHTCGFRVKPQPGTMLCLEGNITNACLKPVPVVLTPNNTNLSGPSSPTAPPPNITIVDDTPQIPPEVAQSVSMLSDLNSLVLDNDATSSINQVPASRVLFKSVLLFFTNFDDLQLYNYIDAQFNPVIESMFEQIQVFEEQKWGLIPFQVIWYDLFGVNLQPIQIYQNRLLRQSFSSNRFLTVESRANGYVLNTVQFYFSNFILMLALFIFGNIVYRLLSCCKLSLKSWAKKFKIWIVFPIFLFDGNVQFMAYLLGFQLENLWFVEFRSKFQSCVMIVWLFILISCTSMIYFFIRMTIADNDAEQFFENCKENLKGIFYMNTIFGVRNILLGFAHYFLPQLNGQVFRKLVVLIEIQLVFFVGRVFLLKIGFFIEKGKQWLLLCIFSVRLLMMLAFVLDVCVYAKVDIQVDILLAQMNGSLMMMFMMFWPLTVLQDLTPFIFVTIAKIVYFFYNKYIKQRGNTIKINVTNPEFRRKDTRFKKARYVIDKAKLIHGEKKVRLVFNHVIQTNIDMMASRENGFDDEEYDIKHQYSTSNCELLNVNVKSHSHVKRLSKCQPMNIKIDELLDYSQPADTKIHSCLKIEHAHHKQRRSVCEQIQLKSNSKHEAIYKKKEKSGNLLEVEEKGAGKKRGSFMSFNMLKPHDFKVTHESLHIN